MKYEAVIFYYIDIIDEVVGYEAQLLELIDS